VSRSALLLSASLFAAASAAHAQTPASSPVAPASQLDRIEQKLDEVLRRLDQLHVAPSMPAQAGSAASGAGTPSPPSAGIPPANADGTLASSALNAAPAASAEAYKPGALAIAHSAPKDVNSLSEVPADSVGGFVYQGGPIAFTGIQTRGVRFAGPVGVELQGWLKAKEAGRYQIGTDLTAHFGVGTMFAPTCFLQAWLEGHSLDQRSVLVSHPGSNNAEASLVLGAELQPGIYRLRVWTACTSPASVTIASELLLKAPSELNLRPVTGSDLLHREGYA